MPSNECETCGIDVDSEYCTRCRAAKHKEQFKTKVVLNLFPTVTVGRVTVRGSEETYPLFPNKQNTK